MNEKLDKKLVEKYPLIFRDRYKPMNQTAMCWGFSHGDGWYNIIDVLCGLMYSGYNQAKERYEFLKESLEENGGKTAWRKPVTQNDVDAAKLKMEEEAEKIPVASQIKEKFGGLRFYVDRATEEHYNYIAFAESMSYRTCERCGAPGKLFTNGWHVVLCDEHAKEEGKLNEKDLDSDS